MLIIKMFKHVIIITPEKTPEFQKVYFKKNSMLKEIGVEISAFVPSLVGKRGPIYEGLPTIENIDL